MLWNRRRLILAGLAGIAGLSRRAWGDVINVTVPGVVPELQQPSDNTCWAAAATMLYSWKNNVSIGIRDVVATAGDTYLKLFDSDTGLDRSNKAGFLSALGLSAEVPQDYLPSGWADLITQRGPIWVTTAEGEGQQFSIHARVLIGIFGDGSGDGTFMTLIDPAVGKKDVESVTGFTQKFDAVAQHDLGPNADLRPQAVRY